MRVRHQTTTLIIKERTEFIQYIISIYLEQNFWLKATR